MRRLPVLAIILLLHGLLLWLLASGFRLRTEPAQRRPVSVHITLAPVNAAAELARLQRQPEPPSSQPVGVRTPAPAPSAQSAPTVPERAAAPAAPGAPAVDWVGEGRLAAQRATEAAAAPKSETFSPPPKGLVKTCVPRERSMEWNGQQDRRVGMDGIVPYVRAGKRCVLILGVLPACALGALPEVEGHLLDDMRDPDRAPSSVPDPNICD